MDRGMIKMVGLWVLVGVVGLATGSARAGTIYVDNGNPACVGGSGQADAYAVVYCKIQDAIDDAEPGDTILVAPSTSYSENIDINKANLTVARDAGQPGEGPDIFTGITPAVRISASGVTLEGLTVVQISAGTGDAHAGSVAVLVEGDVVGPGSVIIENNVLWGSDSDVGVLVIPALSGGHLVVQNNVVASVRDGIHFASDPPAYRSAENAQIELLNNTIMGFDRTAILFGAVHGCTITIDPSTFTGDGTGVPGCGDAGIVFYGGVHDSSRVDVVNTTINNVGAGLVVVGDVNSHSELNAHGLVVNNFREAAVALTSALPADCGALPGEAWNALVDDFSNLRIVDGQFTADNNPATWSYGVAVSGGISQNSGLLVDHTRVTGVDGVGVGLGGWPGSVNHQSTLSVTNSTIEANGADYGIYCNGISDHSALTIDPTTIVGVDYDGIYLGAVGAGPADNSRVDIANTTIAGAGCAAEPPYACEAGASGVEDGIYMSSIVGDSTVSITGSTVVGFSDVGVGGLWSGIHSGGELVLDSGHLIGLPGADESTGVYVDSNVQDDGSVVVVTNETMIEGFTGSGVQIGHEGYGWEPDDWYGLDNGGGLLVEDTRLEGSGAATAIKVHQHIVAGGGGAAQGDVVCTVRDSVLSGAGDGVAFPGPLTEDFVGSILRNDISFEWVGVNFSLWDDLRGSAVQIEENRLIGPGIEIESIGVALWHTIGSDAAVEILGNCFRDMPYGVWVGDEIQDTARVVAYANDFTLADDAHGLFGVYNFGGDADHVIDATFNWWGSAAGPGGENPGVVGVVSTDPWLTGPPDADGDGVDNCSDACPGTPPGGAVDEDGCPLEPTPPPPAGGGAGGNAPDPSSGSGLADANGNFTGTPRDRTGRLLGDLEVTGAMPGDSFAYGVTEGDLGSGDAPGPDAGTFAGFANGLGLGRTLSVTTDAAPGSFVATVSIIFTADELAALGIDPADVVMHVLDTSVDPPVWVPAGTNNVGASAPTGNVGDYGYVVNPDGSVTFWVVRDELSSFAVGALKTTEPKPEPEPAPEPAPEPEPQPAPQPEPEREPETTTTPRICGFGMAPMLLAGVAGLFLMRRTTRRRGR